MKLNYLFLSCLLWSSVASAADMILPINNIHDGDTIETSLPSIPTPLNKVGIRLYGIDTPELHGYACEDEHQLAIKARSRLISIFGTDKVMQVKDMKWDKYGGRIDGKVLTLSGTDVGQTLISEGLAHPYFGAKKTPWCPVK